MPHTVFSTSEVAEYLHVSPENIELLVRRGEIPCKRQGDRVIFYRRDVDVWASQRILGLSEKGLKEYHKTSSHKVRDLSTRTAIVSDLIKVNYIQPDMFSKTRASIIKDLAVLADRTEMVNDRQDLLESLVEREDMCSTALEGGIALLHPRHHEPYMFQDSFLVFGRTVQPIPFGGPDGRTTDLFFLICCQDDRLHLHVLARICMMCSQTDVLHELRQAETAEEVMDSLVRAEMKVMGLL